MLENGKTLKKKLHLTPKDGEEIVISGLSGRFPSSDNVNILRNKLMNKEDLITNECRWEKSHPEVPERMGKIGNAHKFDATFFGVNPKDVNATDPMGRMLLEHTFEAIMDAGLNPASLRGKNVAVIIGACYSETEKIWFYEKSDAKGFGILGCSRAMLANRISHFFDFHGPSYLVDTACSSSLFALQQAYTLIREGYCDAAIVSGTNLCLHPNMTLLFKRLGVLSSDGICKAFDANADGYVRSEAVGSMLLQKAKDANRIYSTIVHAKTNCDGFKDMGITYPSSDLQKNLLQDFYAECQLSPNIVSYLECHGTGTAVGDPAELQAVSSIFCANRTIPLMIGSIKSNLGHTEPASGLCSVAKLIIAMETGVIPPNLNLKNPQKVITESGMIPIVEPTTWKVDYAAINSFGFGGANAHILFKPWGKEKVNNGAPRDDLPRLLAVSGRTEEAVKLLLQEIENQPLDMEYVALLHNIYSTDIPGYLYRGYTILGSKISNTLVKEVRFCESTRRPVWYCSSGLSLQWNKMGEALLRFPIFAEAIKKCDAVLRSYGIDIFDILLTKDESIVNDVLECCVGITAIQIGLVDLLTKVGIVPDNLIGHSLGELSCAYADGCLTAEQTIFAAYSAGLAIKQTDLILGAMAVVGLGHNEMQSTCPGDIDIACRNSSSSSAISGPAESVKNFVAKLKKRKVLATEVACGNVPYHSRYMAKAGPKLLLHLKKAIPTPKPRSAKWVSTSVPRGKWVTPQAKLCSAEYLTNSLLSSVLFEETVELIPANAIVIEIAPHGILQALLQSSLRPTVTTIPLSLPGQKDDAQFFLQALGKLYNAGTQLQLANLYPPVKFPVSRGTPMIAPHIRWDHTQDWLVISCTDTGSASAEKTFNIYPDHEQFSYMMGHIIDHRNLIPATSYLHLVWNIYAQSVGKLFDEISVVFENVRFERATTIQKTAVISLTVFTHRGDGRFEITDKGNRVVSGIIRGLTNPEKDKISRNNLPEINDEEVLSGKDFYKELRLRGYNYQGLFRGVESCSIAGNKGHLSWSGNWASFMDTMLQIQILCNPFRELMVPTSIRKVVIDIEQHHNITTTLTGENRKIPVLAYREFDVVVSGGIEMHGIQTSQINRRRQMSTPVIEEYRFVAYRDQAETSLDEMAQLCIDLYTEVEPARVLNILEFVEDNDLTAEQLVTPLFLRKVNDIPLISSIPVIATALQLFSKDTLPSNVTVIEPENLPTDASIHIAVGYELFSKRRIRCVLQLLSALNSTGFLFTRESIFDDATLDNIQKLGLNILFEKRMGKQTLLFLRKQQKVLDNADVIHVDANKFDWIEKVKVHMQDKGESPTDKRKVILFSHDAESGIIGFANCARMEPNGDSIRTVLIFGNDAANFCLENSFYAKQLELDLPVNVLRGNVWGSYRHVQLPPLEPKSDKHIVIHQKTRGDLSSFQWVIGPLSTHNSRSKVIKVAYATLNFRDIMLASGKLSVNSIVRSPDEVDVLLGFEFSGIDDNGKRVMGLSSSRSTIASLTEAANMFIFDVPDEWTLEQAATVPCVYLTSVCALYVRGNMTKGDKVLIHSGSGGVGQAAIHLALAEGCEVFTTVGTPEKRKFIRETFPSIKDDHIGNSRDTSFEQMIMKMTNGRGVDIVLNSLAEEKLRASLRCLARRGRFLEIGKYDMSMNSELGMYAFLREISFYSIMLDSMMVHPDRMGFEIKDMTLKLIHRGIVKPIVSTCFSVDEVEDAFRYMAAGKHIGKVLIKIRDETGTFDKPLLGCPRFYCKPDRSYILFGGLGGLGLELAHWMLLRGARNIVFVSRNGIVNGYQRMRIEVFKSRGVNAIVVSGLDASKRDDCKKILKSAEELAPVDGIFNLAACLKDSMVINQTEESFEEAVKPKAWITKRLDELSRTLCPELRYFVVFSSISCGKGNPGQSNYGYANSVMERICERRRKEGLPGLAIQWGAIGEVGLVAEKQEIDERFTISGTLQQRLASCFEELDRFLSQDRPIVSSMLVAENSKSTNEAATPVEAVMNIMGIKDMKNVNQETTLAELGMDSMMAVEIKQTLVRDFDIDLSLQDIRNLSFMKLRQTTSASTEEANEKGPDKNANKNLVFVDMQAMLNLLSTDLSNSEDCMIVPTLEADKTTQAFLISGINSDISVFSSIWPKLNFPTRCLRLPLDLAYDTLEKVLDYFMKYVLEDMKHRQKFMVVAYSVGSIFGIEIVRQLEKLGFSGQLVLIDASPEYLQASRASISVITNDSQTDLILFIMSCLNIVIIPEIISKINKYPTWQQKVKIAFQYYKVLNPAADFDIYMLASNIVHKRLEFIDAQSSSYLAPLESPIILLKASESLVHQLQSDYGLSKITRSTVEVFVLDGNHRTIVQDKKIAMIINDAADSNKHDKEQDASTQLPIIPARS